MSRGADTDSTATARELHRTVSPESWCVTLQDLDDFERAVREQLDLGNIPNNSSFPSRGHDDPAIGPSIYQVCEHFIKPVTKRAGGMSYALMLHPEGLDCDVFATHAWAEGVFEFCDKVRRAWPRKARSLWCCFLANPQNLDIAELLAVRPEQSPFGRALERAGTVIVIPNHAVSIYQRLWCSFEAYLAVTKGKRILLPLEVGWRLLLRAVFINVGIPILVGLIVWGVVLATVNFNRETSFRQPLFVLNDLLVSCLAMTGICECKPRLWLIRCGIVYVIANWFYMTLESCLSLLVLAVLLVLNHSYGVAAKNEAQQLAGFESVRRAQCTSAEDRLRILEAIQGKEEQVDLAIRSLMVSGTYDAELGELARQGIFIRRSQLVGFWRWLIPGALLWAANSIWLLCWNVDLRHVFHRDSVCGLAAKAAVVMSVITICAILTHIAIVFCSMRRGVASRALAARLLLNGGLLYQAMPLYALDLLLFYAEDAADDPCFAKWDWAAMDDVSSQLTMTVPGMLIALGAMLTAAAGPVCSARMKSCLLACPVACCRRCATLCPSRAARLERALELHSSSFLAAS